MLLQIHIGLNFRESWILLRNAEGDRTASSEMGLRAVGSVSAEQAGTLGEAQVSDQHFPLGKVFLKVTGYARGTCSVSRGLAEPEEESLLLARCTLCL